MESDFFYIEFELCKVYILYRNKNIKYMDNCWLSPEGEVIVCDNHDLKARELIKERYGIDPSEIPEPSHFLGRKRWMAYHNRPWWVGWWSYYYSKGPTQTQIDRIYELTGEVYKNERW